MNRRSPRVHLGKILSLLGVLALPALSGENPSLPTLLRLNNNQNWKSRLTAYIAAILLLTSLAAHAAENFRVGGLQCEMQENPAGIEDKRYFNNILVGTSLSGYKDRNLIWLGGNVFLKGGTPCDMEKKPLLLPNYDPKLNLVEKPNGWYLELAVDKSWGSTKRQLVTTELLGKALTPNQSFENPDGTPVRITTDYFDKPRDSNNPFPGPFEITQDGTQSIKVWPK